MRRCLTESSNCEQALNGATPWEGCEMAGVMAIAGMLMSLGSAPQQAAPAQTHMVIVGTPTFGISGTTTGATTPFALAIGKPHVIYAGSGKSLCESTSASSGAIDDAGYGWRIETLPRAMTTEGILVLDLTWQRVWQDGRAHDGSVNNTQVRLAPGGRLQLDYLGATATARCEAIGMALEISRPPRPVTGLFEADAWLVPAAAGEPTQHQVVRMRPGDASDFYFNEIVVANGARRALIEGSLTLETHGAGRFESLLKIVRRDAPRSEEGPSGASSGFPLKAAFGETVEFRVPMGEFSLRIRVRQLR